MHVLAKKCRFDMRFQCFEAIFAPNDDVFVLIMSFRCRSFLPHQIVVDILVIGIPEGLVRHPVLEYIADTLNRLASCLVVIEEAMDVGVTVKVLQCSFEVGD